jgi:hypothetical protein
MITTTVRHWLQALRKDRLLVGFGVVTLVVLAPAAGWGVPQATSELTVRGWEVDGVAGIGVLAELSNLASGGRADWYVAYPLFHYLLLALVCVPYLAYAKLSGLLTTPTQAYPYGLTDPTGAFVTLAALGHAVSVLMGAVTVMAVAALGRRAGGTSGGLLAGAIALCSAPFVFYARTGNLDVPALCWTMLALVALERAWSEGLTRQRALAAGVFAALAVATKDQSFGLLVLPIIMVVVRASRAGGTGWQRFRLPMELMAAGAAVFLVAGGIVLRPDRFVRHLDYILNFRDTFTNVQNPTELTVMRGPDLGGRLNLLGDLLRATGTAVGWPVVLAGLAGFVFAWRRVPALALFAASLAGFFVLVVMPIEHMQYRYALAAAVLFGIASAALVVRLPGPSWVRTAVSIALVTTAAAGAAEVTHAMLYDSRWSASAWLRAHASADDTLGFFGRPHQLPHVPPGVQPVALHEGDPRARLLAVKPRWIVVAPDYFAAPGRERSIFLPADLYASLNSGSMGWTRVARFETRGLLRRPLPYLPYVNPAVRIYERRAPE